MFTFLIVLFLASIVEASVPLSMKSTLENQVKRDCEELVTPVPLLKKNKKAHVSTDQHVPISPGLVSPKSAKQEGPPSPTDEGVQVQNVPACLLIAHYIVSHCCSPLEKGDFVAFDNTRLHQLLYYAQGYSLAIYGEKLFDASIKPAQEGVFVNKVAKLLESGNKKKAKVQKELLSRLDSNSLLSEQQKMFLDCIMALTSNSEGSQLASNIEQQSPYLTAKQRRAQSERKAAISDSDLKQFFCEPSQWTPFVCRLFVLSRTNQEFDAVISYVREYLSYNCFSVETLLAIRDQLQTFFAQAETREWLTTIFDSGWTSARHVRWEGQLILDGMLGHLFFPLQFEYQAEYIGTLRLRETLQGMLAISARFGNLYALHEIAEIFADFDKKSDDDIDFEDASKKYFPTVYKKIKQIRKIEDVHMCNQPSYYCGLLCESGFQMNKAFEWYKKGADFGDPLCMFRLAYYSGDDEACRNQMCGMLTNVDSDFAEGLKWLILGEYADDDEKSMVMLEKAGQMGAIEGYYKAARYISTSEMPLTEAHINQVINYLSLAGRYGFLDAFGELAGFCRARADECTKDQESLKSMYARLARKAYLIAERYGYPFAYEALESMNGSLEQPYERSDNESQSYTDHIAYLKVLVRHEY